MVNAREQKVLSRLVDVASLLNYVYDRFNSLREPVQRGDRISIPNIEALTVYPDASVARLFADRNANNPTNANALLTELALIVNQEPWIPVQVPKVSTTQNLGGNWDNALADMAMIQFRNYIDALILDTYIAGQLCWVASGVTTYQHNVAAVSLTPAMLLVARGLLLRTRGTFLRDLLWVFDPLAAAACMGFAGWQNWLMAEQGGGSAKFGADTIGRIYGVEFVESQAVRTGSVHAIATANHAGNVLTLTFTGQQPGLVVGTPCDVAGLNAAWANVANTNIATVSADGLTVTLAVVHADGGNVFQAGATITEDSACNILINRAHMYTAMQIVPWIRWMPDQETSGDILQMGTLLGYLGRVGRARLIRSPLLTV